jgi:hypothetical protein
MGGFYRLANGGLMENFNRVATIIFALIILAGSIIVLLVGFGLVPPESALPCGWWSGQFKGVAEATGGDLAVAIGVGIVLALGMIAVLFFEALPRRGGPPLLISSDEKGLVTIEPESVRLLANNVGLSVHNVRNIDHDVSDAPGGLVIKSNALVALGTNVPQIGAELQARIKEAVEEFTGLPVNRVIVKARYESVKVRSLVAK